VAGEWLKFECSLPEKPETMAITAAMGWDDTDLTVGKLMRLFRWFDQQTLDGNAVGVTPALLDKVIGVTGFVQAVINVRWLTVTDVGLALHNFDRHNGLTAKSRAQTAKRVANHRSKDAPDPLATGDGTQGQNGNAATVTGSLAREEKRREEKTSTSALPPCPHLDLIALFGEHLPTLPQPKPELWRGKKADAMKARWGWVLTTKSSKTGELYAVDAAGALDFFARYFGYVAKSDFLTGRNGSWTGCSLGWLMNEENFAKVLEGHYENKGAA
jgi:hypothetical protein